MSPGGNHIVSQAHAEPSRVLSAGGLWAKDRLNTSAGFPALPRVTDDSPFRLCRSRLAGGRP